jgi:hypothetical protein
MTSLTAKQQVKVRAAHKPFNKEVAGAVVKGTLVILVVFGWVARGEISAWVGTSASKTAASIKAPKPQTVKVIAVDYDRSEYTATTKDPSAGWIRFTAPCAYGHKDTCPTLGMHKADETPSLTEHEISISQPEER